MIITRREAVSSLALGVAKLTGFAGAIFALTKYHSGTLTSCSVRDEKAQGHQAGHRRRVAFMQPGVNNAPGLPVLADRAR